MLIWLTQDSAWSHVLQLWTFRFSVCFVWLLTGGFIHYSVLHKGEKGSSGRRGSSYKQQWHNDIPILSIWNGQGNSCLILILELIQLCYERREMDLGLVTESWCHQTLYATMHLHVGNGGHEDATQQVKQTCHHISYYASLLQSRMYSTCAAIWHHRNSFQQTQIMGNTDVCRSSALEVQPLYSDTRWHVKHHI